MHPKKIEPSNFEKNGLESGRNSDRIMRFVSPYPPQRQPLRADLDQIIPPLIIRFKTTPY